MPTSVRIKLEGCTVETRIPTYVDLKEKSLIGKSAYGGKPVCTENPLGEYVILETKRHGTVFDRENECVVANVSIKCNRTDCNNNSNYKPLPTHPAQK
jgi:hypothetical protein